MRQVAWNWEAIVVVQTYVLFVDGLGILFPNNSELHTHTVISQKPQHNKVNRW